jgi:hypothetical protein
MSNIKTNVRLIVYTKKPDIKNAFSQWMDERLVTLPAMQVARV